MIGITGYSGFVGSNLLKLFQAKEVTLLGRRKLLGYDNFIHLDLEAIDKCLSLDKLTGLDTIIHSAARVHVMRDESDNPLEEYRKVNVWATVALAQKAALAGVKRFIYLSSIKVNGEQTACGNSFSATDIPNPTDAYGVSKAEAERALLKIAKDSKMEVVIIRPPIVYGAGVKGNFHSLMRLVKTGIPIPFKGITRNRRSLISVYNLVDFIKVAVSHPKAANQIFLVSDDHDLSTYEMMELLYDAVGKKSRQFRIHDNLFRVVASAFKVKAKMERITGSLTLDIEKSKELLNWQPPFTVKEGFKLTVENDKSSFGIKEKL